MVRFGEYARRPGETEASSAVVDHNPCACAESSRCCTSASCPSNPTSVHCSKPTRRRLTPPDASAVSESTPAGVFPFSGGGVRQPQREHQLPVDNQQPVPIDTNHPVPTACATATTDRNNDQPNDTQTQRAKSWTGGVEAAVGSFEGIKAKVRLDAAGAPALARRAACVCYQRSLVRQHLLNVR